MSTEAFVQLVRQVIAEELEIPSESLRNDRSLRDEYGLDSVAAVNIIFALESHLGLTIDVRQLASVDSIDDLKDLLLGTDLRVEVPSK
jgi:acyl carrier protein